MSHKVIIPSSAYLKQLDQNLVPNYQAKAQSQHPNSHRINRIREIINGTPGRKPRMLRGGADPGHVFEHLTVFVLHEDQIDEEYLKNEMDVQIHDNFIISSVQPLASSGDIKSTIPEFWHKEKLSIKDVNLTGKGITVGVLDSGIFVGHQEFEGKSITYGQFDNLGKLVGTTPKDFGWHGTHVCGILSGKNAGIAPGVELKVAAVLTEKGGSAGYLAQILGGLNWLLGGNGGSQTTGVHLINASIEASTGFNDYLYSTLETAQSSPGTLMVSAIGNNGSKGENSDSSPGNYNLTLGIGALDQNDNVASFSSWGTVPELGNITKPDLSAPGVFLYSSMPGLDGTLYAQKSGTSQASPVVCGVAALLLEQNPDWLFKPDVLKANIINTVVPITDVKRGGKGRVNIIK